ncbi:carbohydrate ABC transporter permease [Lacisediminimonas profundi]|uniref:carbohydrate ABC transporter permease n=1 Tax=Lacisediminimonas profundi TaxID=2603856 RepID=UPI00124B82F7|nr:sugar ABC transporter permease [Lacisediminimonas profundi]
MASLSIKPGGWSERRDRQLFVGLLPALAILVVLTAAPALYLVLTSLTPLNLAVPGTAWNFDKPFANYVEMLEDPRFTHSVVVQIKLSIASVVLQMLAGLGVALLLNENTRMRLWARSGMLIPMVLPPIVVGITWLALFTVDISPIHRALAWIGLPVGPLLTNPSTALWAIVFAGTWEHFPFAMLMSLAALQMVPESPIEAARIDGASRWQIFWHVRLPFIMPTLVVAGLFILIDSVKAFPLIFIMTDGGPGEVTEVTNFYVYRQAFTFSLWGYGSAIATTMLAAVFLISYFIYGLTTPKNGAPN